MNFKKFTVFSQEAYPSTKLVKTNYDINLLYNIRHNERISYDLNYPKFKLNSRFKYLPDLVSSAEYAASIICCSDKMFTELDFFNISEFSLFDMEVFFKSEYHHFNLLHFPFASNELIDFPKCKFVYTTQTSFYINEEKNIWQPISIESVDDFWEKEAAYTMRCNQLVLKQNAELDFFLIALRVEGGINGFYISDRMSDYLRDREIKGFRLYTTPPSFVHSHKT